MYLLYGGGEKVLIYFRGHYRAVKIVRGNFDVMGTIRRIEYVNRNLIIIVIYQSCNLYDRAVDLHMFFENFMLKRCIEFKLFLFQIDQ